jgi:hypothetical protein
MSDMSQLPYRSQTNHSISKGVQWDVSFLSFMVGVAKSVPPCNVQHFLIGQIANVGCDKRDKEPLSTLPTTCILGCLGNVLFIVGLSLVIARASVRFPSFGSKM